MAATTGRDLRSIQNRYGDLADTEPGLRAALGPPPSPEYEIRVESSPAGTVSRGYQYPFSTHTLVQPSSSRASAVGPLNSGGQNVKGLVAATFCAPASDCESVSIELSDTARRRRSRLEDHKPSAVFCIPELQSPRPTALCTSTLQSSNRPEFLVP